jgi:beta-lactamase regulating signal transducer with metallopeptidase domain
MRPEAIVDFLGRANVEAVGWALVHFLWQGTLVAAVLAVANRLLRQAPPNARYAAAALALLVMLSLPIVTFALVRPSVPEPADVVVGTRCTDCPTASVRVDSGPRSPHAAPPPTRRGHSRASMLPAAWTEGPRTPGVAGRPWREQLARALPALVGIWAAGVTLLSLRFLGGWLVAQRLKRSGRPGRAAPWQETVDRLAHALGIARPVRVLESVLVDVPTVIGWARPVILLPASTLLGLSPSQLEALVAHELAHVRRFDYLVNLIQTGAETLFFFHPAVFFVSRRMRVERELCCDDAAVALCGDAVAYARTLADLEEMRVGAPAVGMAATGGSLLDRVARLLGRPAPHRSAAPHGLAAGLALVVIVGLSATAAAPLAHSTDRPDAPARPLAPVVRALRLAVAAPPVAPVIIAISGQAAPPHPPAEPFPDDVDEPAAPADIEAVVPEPPEAREAPEPPETPQVPDAAEPADPAEPAPALVVPRVGGAKLTVEELIALANSGVTADYVDEMAAAGYSGLAPADLMRLRAHGVCPDFVEELGELGYKGLTPSQLMTLRAHGVGPDFIRELAELGYEHLSITHLVALRAQGVSPDYIRELKSAGLDTVSLSGYIALRSQGVSADYMRELAEMGYRDLSLPRLVALRGSGVSLDYVRELKELGYEGLSVPRLIALRGAGVDPEFVGELKELGYERLPVGALIALRAAGVTPDFVREMQEAGYTKLTPQELIELRSHGVDPKLARARR